jgi:cytochrome P450
MPRHVASAAFGRQSLGLLRSQHVIDRPSPFARLDGPRPAPLLGWHGNLVRFILDPIGYMTPLAERYGSVVPFVRGGSGPVFIREAEHGLVFAFGPACFQAVTTQMSVFHSMRVAGPKESPAYTTLTSGLFAMNEDKHRRQRRAIQPAFQRARLESYHATMVSLTERTLAGLKLGDTCDLVEVMTPLTLAIANKTLFGLDTTSDTLSIGELVQMVIGLAMSPATLVPLNLPFTPRRRLIHTAAHLEHELRAVIASHRATTGDGDDVLSTLLANHDDADADALTEDELVGQLFLLFLAGHDTSKNAIAWTLFLLAQHPSVLADVLDELHGTLGGAPPRHDQLGSLVLLGRVIKESLRLFPPAPFTGRMTVQPTELHGVELPARTELIISPYCLHRDPDLYVDPLQFRPERWETLSRSPFEYAPFGAGPRTCIGSAFATLELTTVLSMLLQRFGLELVSGARIERKTTVVMSPRYGMPMILRPAGTIAPVARVRGNVHEMVALS